MIRNPLNKGGIQSVVMNIIRSLNDEFQIDVLTISNAEGLYDGEVRAYGGEIYRMRINTNGNRFSNSLSFYTRGYHIYNAVKSTIEENGPYCAIHCHIADEAGFALSAAKQCGIPVRIAHAHTAFDSNYHLIARVYTDYLRNLIFKNATNLVACSKKAGEKLYGAHDFLIIYNTVDRRFLDSTTTHTVHTAPHLLQVGLICDNKNQMFTLDILKTLKEKYPESQLVFIGSPKDSVMEHYHNNLKEKAKEEGMNESVHFLPADSDVKTEMQKADYLLLPSHNEGLGIVSLEAQAVGLMCFASTEVPAEVDCGGCVFLSLNDGAESWANRIAQQFEEDHGARQKYDMSRFMPDVIMEQYRKLYRGELD